MSNNKKNILRGFLPIHYPAGNRTLKTSVCSTGKIHSQGIRGQDDGEVFLIEEKEQPNL